jgi:acetylornithine deacetylase
VPDRVEAEGRVGVPIGTDAAEIRSELEATVAQALDDGEASAEVHWTGGAFLPAETPTDDPWARLVAQAVSAERGTPAWTVGVPYGADMRLFTARGIPCVMAGTTGLERAHAIDEWVAVDELVALARIIGRVLSADG